MTQTIHFNTGRKYSDKGQRVTATLHANSVVTFMDHDRGIDGTFKLGLHGQFNEVEVMHWYDAGQAQGNRRSWEDGMLKTGCNAAYKGR